MKTLSSQAKIFISATLFVGTFCIVSALSHGQWGDPARFACFLAVALVASCLKVKLPGVNGTMSVVFLFILVGILMLSLPEVMLLSCAGTLMQCFWRVRNRVQPLQVAFNLSSMATAVYVAEWAFRYGLSPYLKYSMPMLLGATATIFFVVNTMPVAMVISLTENKSVRKVWSECYFWSFPYYLIGAAVAGLVSAVEHFFGWQTSLFVLPIVYFIYRSYRLYLDRLEAEKDHAEKVAALHLRTIEALALAIEAKDHTTHTHLRRVQVYAMEIGKDLGLDDNDLNALRAAAVLHDIGKLAVPEHIISKPGKLTPEEFEKMKIHPIVGAEILERVEFPYAVVPIVRAHHEKWDGTGYPYGLKGEQIPIGARILAVVDCLDALASNRQYRRALSLDQALQAVRADSGKHFDPRVVDALCRRFHDLESMAQAQAAKLPAVARLSTDLKVENGKAPAAGFEISADAALETPTMDFLGMIAAARQEVQTLYELTQSLGTSLSLDDTLSVLSVRLKRLIPHDCIAIYNCKDERLVPEYVNGDDFRLFSSLQIPMGEGVSGWVAQNRKPILNGNPSVEPGYLDDASKFSILRSALAVPLETANGVVGVLTLYAAAGDAFTRDHLRVLLAISSKVALSIENALRFRLAENSATTDYLTGLPNARSLFLHLDSEISRCRRAGQPVTVLVCDLDGFKQVNDRFGHLEGNRVLRQVASKLKTAVREYDYVARMGGDEFVVVMPGLNGESLREAMERFRRLAVDAGHEICGERILSMSVGFSSFPDHGMDAEQLLSDADRRMYAEKQLHHNGLYTDLHFLTSEYMTARVC